ncbi:uncharacterized protein LOC124689577 [Lolium rigidum]|uniref:uncharacterized protein LOC124689577 n=1 Tax=Lolium rigidum TaxID=89674 RepID=UPI001F5CCCB8|nr:uncharacterized protein LOC124689577 [Lolium rigidum]
MTLRRLPCSPAAPPLEDDNLLAEILLRLPPLPSSLPRASAVSRRWRSLASDPRFSRRFRAHHRRSPPHLGCFVNDFRNFLFQPALEAPNRIPPCRFALPIDQDDHFRLLGCRHGLVLILHSSRNQLLVWEPVTGDQYRLDIPPGSGDVFSAAVLRAAGDGRYFQVVLLGTNDMHQACASVYSSETGSWGNLPPRDSIGDATGVYPGMPAVMVGDSLYWVVVVGNSLGILEFDLGGRRPSMMPMPTGPEFCDAWLIRAEGGGLGFLVLSGFSLQLWKRQTDCDGVASWVLGRTTALDKLLPINSDDEQIPVILGYAEDNNAVFVWTSIGVFTVRLESLQFQKFFESEYWYKYYPFEGVYTADKGMDGQHNGAELLQNT